MIFLQKLPILCHNMGGFRGERTQSELARLNADQIALAAYCKFKHITPENLSRLGDVNRASILANAFSQLQEQGLWGVVETRAKSLAAEAKTGKTIAAPWDFSVPTTSQYATTTEPPPTLVEPQFKTVRGNKVGFLTLDPSWLMGERLTQKDKDTIAELLTNPEALLEAMHRRYQSRSRQKRREFDREVANEVARAWQKLLKQWGVATWAQKQYVLREKMEGSVRLFQLLGLWEKIANEKLDYALVKEIQSVLSESQVVIHDFSSSEGVTIFASKLALALDQMRD
ncbi:MAG: hypothetical protein UV61_C0015G0010 [Candidatus Gottesmanbacteria bacterium GW2011_GWB1_43_11]|uniref:Uncharacterized protein n=1 Tax=Candidatus Gottesmanbacteria bacterium GW2011_GWB1_43_11 TaxID=1618446 RepID=A0A0G1ERU9_9BACT|nr:MAG: hypothetical protein UV04_C0036G0016 [Candidatus Gottesmanbacteria bacterium GW2011_GWA2_42_16]KKS81111.1 MAG: hypothetical protein UV55_C0021G0012 [Candidatus Gottesmanbacteria bacterium GW2011_GWC1_43_10]KKS85796.1 MAG: hypothetical protein UV61_C0015G0010 [Candidatus Gottesmanbacteria bacterium GW2011_GWB1_43_11]